MVEPELYSWLFVSKEWDKLRRMPTPDQGFEESFREYLYRKINFDVVSDTGDTGLGLSYSTLSDTPHELDVVCRKEKSLFIFELKHYQVSSLTKEIVFTFLGKVLDFYFKNAALLSSFGLTMLLVTTNRSVDAPIRRLCMTYGIKLIEPCRMPLSVLDYFGRDLYSKIQDADTELKVTIENLLKAIAEVKESYDYTFSDLFRFRDDGIHVQPLPWVTPTQALREVDRCHVTFEMVRNRWQLERK